MEEKNSRTISLTLMEIEVMLEFAERAQEEAADLPAHQKVFIVSGMRKMKEKLERAKLALEHN